MKKFILGFIIGSLLFGGLAYALRLESLQQLTDLSDPNQITRLNNYLEKMQSILNGRITLDVETSVPTKAADEGDIKLFNSGGTYRIYAFLDGAWRAFSSD